MQKSRERLLKAVVLLLTGLLTILYLLLGDLRVARAPVADGVYTLTHEQLGQSVWFLQPPSGSEIKIALDGQAYLSVPKAHADNLLVNGAPRAPLTLGTRVLVPLEAGVSSVSLRAQSGTFDFLQMSDTMQLGLLDKLILTENARAQSRGFYNGFFIFSILFALTLFIWKPSETYLLIYMLHALVYFSMNIAPLISWLTALTPGFAAAYDACQQAWSALNRYGTLSLLYPLFTAVVHWLLYREFVDDRILGVRYPVYLGASYILIALAMVVLHGRLDEQWMFFLLYFLVCLCEGYILLFNAPREEQRSFGLILLAAWCVSFVFWLVRAMNNLGFIDYVHSMGSLIAASYSIGFLICINGKFSHKFLLADHLAQRTQEMNRHLEEMVEKKTKDLKLSYAHLEEVQRQKNEFVSNIIHNLKTPLFSLSGYTELLEHEMRGQSDEAREYLSLIRGNADYAQQMIRHLLLFNRLEERRITFHRIDFNLGASLRRIADECRVRLQGKGLSLQVVIDDEPLIFCGDELYLRQAVQNIVDNAIEHSPPGKAICMNAARRDGFVRIAVRDFGTGIDPDVLPHIMERCYSYHPDGQKSSGLGLNIAQEIATAHEGRIQVRSAPGEGSEFTLILPIRQTQEDMQDEL